MTDEEKAAAAAQAKADQEAADAAAALAAKNATPGNTDTPAVDPAVAAAQAEAARLQAIVDSFAGVDPAKAKADAAAVAAAEAARVQAEKDKAKAEGDFAKLKELQDAETTATINAAKEEARVAKEEAAVARREANEQKVATAFANSEFLAKETILSGERAQRLFSDHVEIEAGKVVVYDKPAGEAKRAKVMDAKGNPLPFNDAIAKVINSQSDKDTLLKSKTLPGTGSKTTDGKVAPTDGSRHSKLSAGLKALRAK